MLLWLDAVPARTFLNRMQRDRAPTQLLGSTRMDNPRFYGQLPAWVDGRLAIPMLRATHETARDTESLVTAVTHDTVRAIARACATGADAAGVRDALATTGVTGLRALTFSFDEHGNRKGEIPTGIISRGKQRGHSAFSSSSSSQLEVLEEKAECPLFLFADGEAAPH